LILSGRSRLFTLAVSVGLVAGGLVAAAAPAGAGPVWSLLSTPDPGGSSGVTLRAVACPTTTSCFAVGSYGSGSTTKPLAEHWNGSSWSIQSTPVPGGTDAANLSGVSCPSTKSCFAVGSYAAGSTQLPLVEHWNGSAWGVQGSAAPGGSAGAGLTGVSCPNPKSCFAVGNFSTSFSINPLAEHWNGSSWSVQASPNPSGSSSTTLRGVSCPSAKSCFAVGVYTTSTATKTLAEHWNGSSWGVLASANPGGSTVAALTSVSCPSTKSCFAVGNYSAGSGSRTLAEHWNGSSWAQQATVNPSSATSLNGVSCPNTKSCFAIGNSQIKNLVEHWNGSNWGTTAIPSPQLIAHAAGVTCPSARICFAVGSVTNSGASKAMTLRYR
jgi:hypothetical protein